MEAVLRNHPGKSEEVEADVEAFEMDMKKVLKVRLNECLREALMAPCFPCMFQSGTVLLFYVPTYALYRSIFTT